jgi:hypothetical protein
LVGVYENGNLIEQIEKEGKTSDVLPLIVQQLLQKYNLNSIYFVNGPGSFMAIKVTFIFLKTLSIVKKIKLYSTCGFHFNKNMPIKATKYIYFLKEDDRISTKKIKDAVNSKFYLPEKLDVSLFSQKIDPVYVLDAV